MGTLLPATAHTMRGLCLACVALCSGLGVSQETPESTTTATDTTTIAPVEIVKQVNEINEDGSYSVGHEASDGTFKLETRDTEGNVEGKYGFIDENGELKVVEYSSNNSTGFSTDLTGPVDTSVPPALPLVADPAFALEAERHAAVLAHQQEVVARQQQIAEQRELDAQRQAIASQQSTQQGFNFNPQQPSAAQFNPQQFQQPQQFQRPQQFQQQPQRFNPQQFAQLPRQAQSQFPPQAFQGSQSAFQQPPQFRQPQAQAPRISQAQLNQLFAQSSPSQRQQFAPQQQQFAFQQQQFAPQSQFAPQQQFFRQ